MLSPIVIPVPLALALVVLLAVAVYAANRILEGATIVNPWAGQSWAWNAPSKPSGRHRPENIAEPIDWATLTARRLNAEHRARYAPRPAIQAAPLEIAGLPDREPVEPGPLHIIAEDTRELATAA